MSLSPIGEKYLAASRKTLEVWHGRINKCLDRLTEEQIWWRGAEPSNAVGNLVLHLSGNVRQWIISGVGGAPDTRNRDAEFAQRETMPTEELRARLGAAVREADEVLGRLTDEDLLEKRRIQDVYDVTVLQAIHHVTEHFAMHAGQILYATKLLTREDLGFYSFLKKKK